MGGILGSFLGKEKRTKKFIWTKVFEKTEE